MKQLTLLLLVVLFTISGCKKDDEPTPDYTSTFVGTWKATAVVQDGQTVSLINDPEFALYLKFKATGVNKVSAILKTVIVTDTLDSESAELNITKSGDTFNLIEVGTTSSHQNGYLRYTSSNGELKLGSVENGKTSEFTFKK
ncbi:hypothetical protein [Arcicella lustrica]|uniref:Lipocalin-like domain-containing protein n=1 Tax=Arcicella lustrica TaxID=2984196 RepID=A0ABU5SCZ2_9BACT|nr:hypothetical protein [Arcicella sp. DC25W]MEA5425153.1 hypothetical protein [Arcicella sp. DC25W]